MIIRIYFLFLSFMVDHSIFVLMLLSGCVRKECEEKVKDLEFTVTKEEELPEALRQQIEEKKEGDFRFTYSDNEYLYVARGYGIQETGGYSISVEDCYLSDTAICVKMKPRLNHWGVRRKMRLSSRMLVMVRGI